MKVEKPAILKYVNFWKKTFIIFSVIALPAMLVCFIYATLGYAAFWFIAPAVLVFYLIVYGFYAVFVSLGTAIGFETTDKVVYVKTKRKTYTYDVRMGCKAVKESKRKFVCTFETQDSRDKFTFLKKVMFARSYEDQFSAAEISSFYPPLASEGGSK